MNANANENCEAALRHIESKFGAPAPVRSFTNKEQVRKVAGKAVAKPRGYSLYPEDVAMIRELRRTLEDATDSDVSVSMALRVCLRLFAQGSFTDEDKLAAYRSLYETDRRRAS